jgi:hypothetical protein
MSVPPATYLSVPYAGFPQYAAATDAGIERQIIPEVVQVPYQQTVMVPQITYQQRYVQVPVQQTVQIPRQVSFLTVSKILACQL